jgi:uncharacterized membrane protein required for colicin V production
MDDGQTSFFIGATVLVCLMAYRGWRLGIVRQTFSIFSLGIAYAAAWFGGPYLIQVLRPLGFPDRVLSIIGSALIGTFLYLLFALLSALVFKKTAHQKFGPVRFGFGAAGAILGAAFGIFLVLVLSVAIRLLGSLGENKTVIRNPKSAQPAPPPSPLTQGLAQLKHSIESGPAGEIITHVDPIPEQVYDTLGKFGRLVANPESLSRFTELPKVKSLSAHPKLLALRDDPDIAKAIREQDFLSLLRNPKLVEAANDPEVAKVVGEFDINKALDAALKEQDQSQAFSPARH